MAVDFKAKQAEFAAYIRDPAKYPAPSDVQPQRMTMYRELFFNNIDSFLSSTFPVLRTILNDQQWQALGQDFYTQHRCQTPYFSEIAEEFLDYLQNQRPPANDYPFLLELAHYEWVEMALSIAKVEPRFGDADFAEQVLARRLALSPLAWPLVYQYPVERISPEFLPKSAPAQPTYLIVYRDADDAVHFMQTTSLTIRLLEVIEQQQAGTGEAVLQGLAVEVQQLTPETVHQFGLDTLRELAAKGIIIPADDA